MRTIIGDLNLEAYGSRQGIETLSFSIRKLDIEKTKIPLLRFNMGVKPYWILKKSKMFLFKTSRPYTRMIIKEIKIQKTIC